MRPDNRSRVMRRGYQNSLHRARLTVGEWLLRELQFPLPPLSADCVAIACRATDELLNGEVFYTLREAQILIERWRRHYNTVRPHSALGYRPPRQKARCR